MGNEGVQRKFRYISAENRAAEKITMTAPVEQEAAFAKIGTSASVQQRRPGARRRIAFVRPRSYTLANAPRPADHRVVLAEAPPRRIAVVRYRGTWSEAPYGKELAVLRKCIGERGLTASLSSRASIRPSCRVFYSVLGSRSRCRPPLRGDANPSEASSHT